MSRLQAAAPYQPPPAATIPTPTSQHSLPSKEGESDEQGFWVRFALHTEESDQ
jgi:hypothetical protein